VFGAIHSALLEMSMRRGLLLALTVVLPLAGCTDDEDFVNDALDQARAHCEEQGKQFVPKEQPKVETGELSARNIDIEGSCVGPGEPGYKPAKN
jgi:hypothetical protein